VFRSEIASAGKQAYEIIVFTYRSIICASFLIILRSNLLRFAHGICFEAGRTAANIVNPGDTVVVRDGIAQASHTGLVVSFQWWSEFWKSRIQR